MGNDRWSRFAPLTGAASMILFVVAALMVNEYDYLPESSEITESLLDNSSRLQAAGYIGIVSAALLLWFSGSLRVKLRSAEGGQGRLSAVAFGGGVAAATSYFVSYGALLAASARANSDSGIESDTAVALWDLYTTLLGNIAQPALGVVILATAVVSFRTSVLARWLTWVSLVLGLVLITPAAYVVIPVALLWFVWVSILLYRDEPVTTT